ncbi:lysylphosphatidylglycerol synthase transmembrane domain-containing protein [Halovenus marina]|uniref:lysylphosphatidylglycerol synthase transmembrane domain-containing protein n=1 Tax=Halovenus marina TaxID=3396621 RepID=UPI003F574932
MIDKRQAAMALIVWFLVFMALITLAGIEDFVDNVSTIPADRFAVMLVAVAVGAVAMGSTLYIVGRSLDMGVSWFRSIFLNTVMSLASNLTPFGQAGGIPVGGAILTRYSKAKYEESLAVLSIKDIVSFVPSTMIFIFGGSYLTLYAQSLPTRLRPIFGAFSMLILVVALVAVGIRLYPDVTLRWLHRIVALLNRTVARLPLLPSFDEDEIRERVEGFWESLGKIATDRVTVVVAIALTTTSFLAQGTLLWLTLDALGVDISIALAIFIVPVSLLAGATPLPGGSGGVESVQILIIIATTGAASSPTITGVILARGLVYWTPIILGTLTLIALQIEERRSAVVPED